MVAHGGSQWRLLRQPWRSRAIQFLTALLCLASPIVFAPSALHEEQVGHWVRAGLPKSAVEKLVLPGGTASFRYALVAGDGVYRAPEGTGMTWRAVDADLPSRRWNNVEVQTLAAHPSDPSMVYVGMGGAGSRDPARSAGLYVTNDDGQTWQSPVESTAGEEVQIIAVMPQVPALPAGNGGATQPKEPDSVVCAATVGAIYCNTGVNRSWVRLDWRGTERVLSMAIRPGDPHVIYVGTAGFGLVTTTNRGVTWKQSHVDLQYRQVYDIVMPVSRPDVLYVATDDGLFVSMDAGSTWIHLDGPTKGRRVNTIALCPGTAASGEAVATSTNAGGDEIALCVGLQHGAAYRSVDGGRSWEALNKGLGSMTILSLAVDPQDPSVLWAGTTDGVWRYTLPVAQGRPTALSSPTERPLPSPTARLQPSPTAGPKPSPTVAPTATAVSLPQPEPTLTSTRTALPTATPTPSSTATMAPAPTATRLPPTATRTVAVPPTLTPAPSPIPTSTEAPLPPPEPPKPRPIPTRAPR